MCAANVHAPSHRRRANLLVKINLGRSHSDRQARYFVQERYLLANISLEKLQNKFPPNLVRNQKYNVVTFLPIVFYEQFKFFFNLYFLLVALSQFIPALKIGMNSVVLRSDVC